MFDCLFGINLLLKDPTVPLYWLRLTGIAYKKSWLHLTFKHYKKY